MCNSSLRGVGTVRISEKFDQKDDYLDGGFERSVWLSLAPGGAEEQIELGAGVFF